MLPSENEALYERILAAAKSAFPHRKNMAVFFEHGHWWAMDNDTGAQWDVVDAEGMDTFDGFGFEQVTEDDYR